MEGYLFHPLLLDGAKWSVFVVKELRSERESIRSFLKSFRANVAQHQWVNPSDETVWKSIEGARHRGFRNGRGGGSGEPLPDGSIAEETLVLEIIEPCPGEGFEILLQPRVDVGFLAVIVIVVNLLQEAHIIVPER